MQKLNFPEFKFRFKNSENKTFIFDVVRKKFVLLTPEEWVRQQVLLFLHQIKKYPLSLINVEKKMILNGTIKRYDLVIFKPNGNLFLLVECKAPDVEINQHTFDQIARYNLLLKSDYLMVTNGFNHYYCTMDYQKNKYHFLQEIPDYSLENLC